MGEWRYRSTIPDLGTRWMWIVSFTPRPLYLRRKSPRYPLDRRLGGHHTWSGRCRIEKYLLPLPGIKLRPVQHLTCHYTDWAIPALNSLTMCSFLHVLQRMHDVLEIDPTAKPWSSACFKQSFTRLPLCCIESIFIHTYIGTFFPLALRPQFGPWPTSMKLSVSLRFTRS
jgi:hypothetical protein